MKSFLSNTFVKWFKNLGFAGALRFKILYWAYRLTGWHIRHKEWDFVLDYLPCLGNWQEVKVLDVGCARNLFCFEVKLRGYELIGIDLENPVKNYPGKFSIQDIRDDDCVEKGFCDFDFVTCISVLEHIEEGKDVALNNMISSLKIGGRLLITIPTTEFSQGHPWDGFTLDKFIQMLPSNCELAEYTERAGQMCMAIERIR